MRALAGSEFYSSEKNCFIYFHDTDFEITVDPYFYNKSMVWIIV